MKEQFEENILKTIKKYEQIKSGDTLVIGVSGGPDSICLLTVLNNQKEKLGIKIYVAHINHMIRKEAIDEEKYVKEFCEKLGIECFVKRADILKIAKKEKMGTEETGRKIRYEFLKRYIKR